MAQQEAAERARAEQGAREAAEQLRRELQAAQERLADAQQQRCACPTALSASTRLLCSYRLMEGRHDRRKTVICPSAERPVRLGRYLLTPTPRWSAALPGGRDGVVREAADGARREAAAEAAGRLAAVLSQNAELAAQMQALTQHGAQVRRPANRLHDGVCATDTWLLLPLRSWAPSPSRARGARCLPLADVQPTLQVCQRQEVRMQRTAAETRFS